MKIEINVDENAKDLQVAITCKELTPEIEKILARLRMMNRQLTVYREGEIYLLDIAQVIYVESVDRKCFVYTKDEIYQSDFKLYEMQEQLEECGFFRINKSCLIAIRSISSLRADVNRRIRITLCNGEQLIASRQYAEDLKKRLGVR